MSYYATAQQALHQWGAWARRPQFWCNLRGHGMFALLPLPQDSRPERSIRLDPFSRRIHTRVMLLPDAEAGILYAYYVRQVTYEQQPDPFRAHGYSKGRYYDTLKAATLMAYNGARK